MEKNIYKDWKHQTLKEAKEILENPPEEIEQILYERQEKFNNLNKSSR